MGYMHDDWNEWGHGALWFGIAHLLFWALLIGAVVYVATRLIRNSNSSSQISSKESPLEILDRRLAQGEVSKDDYIVARELLESNKKKK